MAFRANEMNRYIEVRLYPAIHGADKVSWGVPVEDEYVKSHFPEYIPQLKKVLDLVPTGEWREFAAFAGPELSQLTAWDNKIVLVGDASHALSGAFGSGAGFAMEDGWVLAEALKYFKNNLGNALSLFNAIRVPYYSRMYAHLASEGAKRAKILRALEDPSYDERVRVKIVKDGGGGMDWIYKNDIAEVWQNAVREVGKTQTLHTPDY